MNSDWVMARDKPNLPHDCDACVFVENMAGRDWYVCPASEHESSGTVVGRHGLDGDYWSMSVDSLERNKPYYLTKDDDGNMIRRTFMMRVLALAVLETYRENETRKKG